MYNHEPKEYSCPLCVVVDGGETKHNKQSDIVYKDEDVIAFTSPRWWVHNPGNILVIPRKHVENIYDIEDALLAKVQVVGKKIAKAIKETYKCDGISFRQHNEPDGDQCVWHFHLHIFPRWKDDELYLNHKNLSFVHENKRAPYAKLLKEHLSRE